MPRVEIKPQSGPQWQFSATCADIAIYGGSAGSGKSFGLLLEPVRHFKNPVFKSVMFRRTSVQIRAPGSLWDQSLALYSQMKANPREALLEWKFPSGMSVKFSHLENEKDIYAWQGSQIPLVCFDELVHFSEKQFWYLMSRLRSLSGVPGYIRATCNPDPDSFVRSLIDWYIGEDGFPISERSGKLRWFIRQNDTIIWNDSRQALISEYGADQEPKSFTFIAAKIFDNQILMQKDPTYLSNLKALSRVDRMRLLDGNWNVRATAGMLFRREWFRMVDAIPAGWIQAIRAWDRACLIADTKVITNQGEKKIKNIKIGDLVLTRKGFKKVIWSGVSKTTNKIISVVFSNGAVISGTSCHPIYTNNRGWIKLSELKGNDRVLCKKWLSTEKDTSSSMAANIISTINGTITITNTSERKVDTDCYIETFGNSIMDPYPMGILSTTRMETELITELQILNAYPGKSTGKSTNLISHSKLISKINAITIKHSKLFQRKHRNSKNINVSLAGNHSEPKVLKQNIAHGDVLNLNSINANNVESLLKPDDLPQNIAASHALIEDVPVYDLTVEDAHEFFANGILVHNSTKPNESNKDPDWTRGLLLLKYPNGTFIVADVKSIRDTPLQVENMIRNTASQDSANVRIIAQQDPGSAGVSEAEHFMRMLQGYWVETVVLSKDKLTRAKPVSAQSEVGNICILRGSWNSEFFNELENFSEDYTGHDDQIDALSLAFNSLATGISTADAMWNHRR